MESEIWLIRGDVEPEDRELWDQLVKKLEEVCNDPKFERLGLSV